MDYYSAKKLFETARYPDRGKPVGPGKHTRLVKDGENYAIRLHNTNVVTYQPDGWIILNDGGYGTVTTKARINEYAPVKIWQKQGEWYINYKGNHYIFQSGMEVHLKMHWVYLDNHEMAPIFIF